MATKRDIEAVERRDCQESAPETLERLIQTAERAQASDIHLQMRADSATVSYRLDGVITPVADTATDLGYVWSPVRTPRQVEGWLRNEAVSGLRSAVAGDDSALYNCLLLTLRDAARVPGRKVVIVFSNGPDNASMVAPDDVRAVAEDEGIPIYVISTNEVTKDPVSSNVFKRISTGTGGKSYFAKTWQKQVEAFEAIREDLGNSYTVTYYPQTNPNEGFRKISVEVLSDAGKKYRVQARPGYRPHGGF